MIISHNVPKILFIKGVFKKDCLTDDLFTNKILENAHISDISKEDITNLNESNNISTGFMSEMTQYTNYEKLPTSFYGLNSWPQRTNIHCWHCTLSFDGRPVFIPKVIEPTPSKDTSISKKEYNISVYGVFCSFACANTYINTRNYGIADKIDNINKLKFLYKLFNNVKMTDIVNSPNPYKLKKFGGDLTNDEFRKTYSI
jgi:hypothetical protein